MCLGFNKRGFTLLELIVVIIIISVLTSIALPRYFGLIESSRSAEALINMSAMREAVERVYLMAGDYTTTCLTGPFFNSDQLYQCLGIDNLDKSPNAHFSYRLDWIDPTEYGITASRNSYEGGNTSDRITRTQLNTAISTCGTGAFRRVGPSPCS